jgi:IS5 family transposase
MSEAQGLDREDRLKETWSELASRRTETAYEAVVIGRTSSTERSPYHPGSPLHHRRCHEHCGAELDQEPGKARDLGMHQTRKGQQWYFGMKLHIGVDSQTKLIHSMTTTAANVHDATVLGELLHGNETRVYGDQAYRGQKAVIREHAPNAKDFTNKRYRHRGIVDEVERGKNRTKSGVRAKVEHPIGVIKRVFGFAKVRYRGLAKNTQRLWVSCGLANLFIVRRRLLRA